VSGVVAPAGGRAGAARWARLADRRVVIALLIVAGVALRAAEYLDGRSLWLDEAFLSLNVIGRSLAGLFGTLDYQQGAPVGFLLLQKCAVSLFGTGEYALRLVPFLGSIATLVFGALLAARWLGREAAWLAVALLALCDPLVWYAAEAKQYGLDATVTVVLLWAGVRASQERSDAAWRSLAALGALLVWFSHPAVFVLAGVGALLAAQAYRERDARVLRRVALAAAVWAAGFVPCAVVSLRPLAENRFFETFWAQDFVPPLADLAWFARHVASGFAGFLDLTPSAYFLAGWCAAGVVGCAIRRPALLAAAVTTLAAAVVASSLRLYPLEGRFLMFAVPIVVFLLAEGLLVVRSVLRRGGAPAQVAGALLVAAVFVFPASRALAEFRSPRVVEEIKPILQHVREHARADDAIYVFHLAGYPFRYYAERYSFNPAIDLPRSYASSPPGSAAGGPRLFEAPGRNPIVLGSVSYFTSEAFRDIVRDFEPLLGRDRVWVVLAHHAGGMSVGRSMLAYLDRVGRRLDGVQRPGRFGGAEAYLYDLSDARSRAAEVDAGPTGPEESYRAALEANRAGDPERALRLLERLERSTPLSGEALFAKAYALQLYGNTEEAVLAYRRLLAAEPGRLQARFFLGVALQQLDRCDEAVPMLRQVVVAQPDAGPARELIARCRVRTAGRPVHR
jgi:tetratricopeptide (TPR) repeat protein